MLQWNNLEIGDLQWKNCIGICTDRIAAKVGPNESFASRAKERNLNVILTHCFLHCDALVFKTLPVDLFPVLNDVVSIVNIVMMQPAKSCLFVLLCEEKGAKHTALLLCIKVRWLLRGKVLAHVYELREELKSVHNYQKTRFAQLLASDEEWCGKLAYLADIFYHSNTLNSQMLGQNENLLTSTNKINRL